MLLQINYELLAELVTHVVQHQQEHGAAACMAGWEEGRAALAKVQGRQKCLRTSGCRALTPAPHAHLQVPQLGSHGAVLVFLPGAPEISRAGRALQACTTLAEAAGGSNKLMVSAWKGEDTELTHIYCCVDPGWTLAFGLCTCPAWPAASSSCGQDGA